MDQVKTAKPEHLAATSRLPNYRDESRATIRTLEKGLTFRLVYVTRHLTQYFYLSLVTKRLSYHQRRPTKGFPDVVNGHRVIY